MQIENLLQKDVDEIESLINQLKKDNKGITYSKYFMSEKSSNLDNIDKRLSDIENKIENLCLLIKHIFGNSVLVDGNFLDLEKIIRGR